MKLTKRLIPAFAMLLVSAVLMSTASFAWFSMNTNVTATGMNVTAKTDAIFLEIKGTSDSDFGVTGTAGLNADLYPVAHETFSSISDVATPGKWYYQYSNDPSNYQAAPTSEKKALGAFDNYVATTTYSVKLNDSSVDTAYDLYVSAISIPENKGITVVIVGANGYQEFRTSSNKIDFAAGNVLADTVTKTEQSVTVYIYFDGNNQNVFSNNLAALTGSIEFTLTASGADN